tara:strand:- start:1159 stop:1473 length:315 start_codon:yes stop_codon:yes gene_type:complete
MEKKQKRHVRTTSMDEKTLGDELELELALMVSESPGKETAPKREDSSPIKEDSGPQKEESSPKRAVSFTVPEVSSTETVTLQKPQETPSPALADGKSAEFVRFL